MPESVHPLRRLVRHVVVVLVGLHLLAITLQALPSPGGGLNRKDWSQPTVQGEFDAWAARLGAVGIQTTGAELQDVIYPIAVGYAKGHGSLLEPFKPYYRYCGTWQSWRMFVAPHRHPSRLQIRLRIDGRWVEAYEARSPTATWLGPQLDHDRFRAALFRYGWGNKYPRQWRSFGEWVADRAARDVPQADRVQLRFANIRTPSPGDTRAGVEPDVRWQRNLILRPGAER